MKIRVYHLVLFILLFFYMTAAAVMETKERPVDPNQKKIWDFEQQLRLGPITVSKGGSTNLSLSQVKVPQLNNTGAWNINPASGHGSISSMTVYLMMKDYLPEYSVVYYKFYSQNIPSVFESCEFVTSGDYQLYVEVRYSDYSSGIAWLEFTIGGTSALLAKVNQVVSSCKKSSDWDTALCLHDWIAKNMKYGGDFYGADGALLRGLGVCDSYSKAYFMLCQKAGIPVGRVVGGDHAWNVIKLNGKWYYVDVTWDDGDNETVPVGYTYFCINEEALKVDHTIQDYEGEYGPCTSLEMNYYVVTGEWKNWLVYSSVTYDDIPLIDDIVMTFEDQGQATYTIDESKTSSCYKTSDSSTLCFGSSEVRFIVLSYILPLSASEIKESDGTPMNVRITQSPLTITLLTPINVLRLPENMYIVESQSFYGIGAKTVVLPQRCWKIESQAFANSNVKRVVFPKYISIYNSNDIASDAFANCSNLVFVTSNENVINYAQAHGITVKER